MWGVARKGLLQTMQTAGAVERQRRGAAAGLLVCAPPSPHDAHRCGMVLHALTMVGTMITPPPTPTMLPKTPAGKETSGRANLPGAAMQLAPK